jgi:chromosome segregation ATPase
VTQDSEALEILVREVGVLTTMLRKREEQVNEYAHSALRVAEANADLAARTARAEDAIGRLRDEITQARSETEQARSETEQARSETEQAKQQLGKANARVKAMERSRSWRWTRFLRRGK